MAPAAKFAAKGRARVKSTRHSQTRSRPLRRCHTRFLGVSALIVDRDSQDFLENNI